MDPTKPRPADRDSGPFLGPDILVPVRLRTLSDEYRDQPTEPEGSDREPAPAPPGLVDRIIERLRRRSDPGR